MARTPPRSGSGAPAIHSNAVPRMLCARKFRLHERTASMLMSKPSIVSNRGSFRISVMPRAPEPQQRSATIRLRDAIAAARRAGSISGRDDERGLKVSPYRVKSLPPKFTFIASIEKRVFDAAAKSHCGKGPVRLLWRFARERVAHRGKVMERNCGIEMMLDVIHAVRPEKSCQERRTQ